MSVAACVHADARVTLRRRGSLGFAHMTTELPTTTSEITAKWLTAALRESGTIGDDVSVAAVETRDTGSGIGFMGEVGTVDVVYEGEAGGAPTTVVAKFPTASPEVRAMMHPTRVYEREHTFYRELADQTPLRTPNHFHITCVVSDDPHAEQYMMLMEDLSHLTIGDQLTGSRWIRPAPRSSGWPPTMPVSGTRAVSTTPLSSRSSTARSTRPASRSTRRRIQVSSRYSVMCSISRNLSSISSSQSRMELVSIRKLRLIRRPLLSDIPCQFLNESLIRA